MRKITTGEVLRAICEEVPINRKRNDPITKSKFKDAMLSSELFTSKTSILLRWDQLYNKIELLQDRGVKANTKEQYIILDIDAVERLFKTENTPLPFDWEGCIYTHTHTEVKGGSE